MIRCPSVAFLEKALRAESGDGRRALAHPQAIIIRMADDILRLREDAADRRRLREFGWRDEQIDAWFESACQEADKIGALT